MTVRKFLGKEGRTTIPYPIRERLGWEEGDIISFTEDNPKNNEPDQAEEKLTLHDALDGLTEQEQREALIYLTMKWAAQQAGASRR